MSAHKVLFDVHNADSLADPGDAGTITVDRSPCRVALTSTTAETRTLAVPTRAGVQVLIYGRTVGGTITLTVTSGYNPDGDTTFSITTAGQFVKFESVESAADTFRWRKTADYESANILPADSAILQDLSGLTATADELNRSSDMSTRVVDCTASTLAVTEALHDGKIITLNRAAGIAVTLPVPVAGMWFRFIVQTTFTGAASIKSTAGTQIMIGHALLGNDSDNTTVLWQALAASTYDTIDLFGTANSTGGIAGQTIEIRALSSTVWHVVIVGDAAGTEATPFSDTVA